MFFGSRSMPGRLANFDTDSNALELVVRGGLTNLPETPKPKFQIPKKLQAPNFKRRHASRAVFRNWRLVIGDSLVLGGWDLVLATSAPLFAFRLRSFPKNCRPDADEGCAFLDRNSEILGHSHRKLGKIDM